ncbi:hypothetical protein ES703_54462 [subsurface metagenome]
MATPCRYQSCTFNGSCLSEGCGNIDRETGQPIAQRIGNSENHCLSAFVCESSSYYANRFFAHDILKTQAHGRTWGQSQLLCL